MKIYHACVSFFPYRRWFCLLLLIPHQLYKLTTALTPDSKGRAVEERDAPINLLCVSVSAGQTEYSTPILKDCKASSVLVVMKSQLKLNKGISYLQSAIEKCFVRECCITFLKMNCFLSSERKLVTVTLIHISQFPLYFPLSKNIKFPFKKKTMDIAFLTLLWLLSIWNNPSCVSCYTDNKSNYSL